MDAARDAWRRYQRTGEIRADLLRAPILRAWRRCHLAGTQPSAMEARRLAPDELRERIERRAQLVTAARPYLRALSVAATGERHAAMLADRDGVVLDLAGDDVTLHDTLGFPVRGSILSEAVAGANGVGTTLIEDRYFELVGAEHFIEGFQEYTCQGSPVRGALSTPAGALSISVRRAEAAARVREILICAARGIQAELTSQKISADILRLARARPGDAATFDKLREDLVQIHAAARLRLDSAARAARKDRPAEVMTLIDAADRLVRKFEIIAAQFRQIAGSEESAPVAVELRSRLVEMVSLLGTEAAVRRLRLLVRPGPEVWIVIGPHELSRALFRTFLAAMERRPPGSSVEVEVCVDWPLGVATWAFSPPSPEVALRCPLRLSPVPGAGA
ncbi:MAG: hypothetical protein R3F14_37100 [Polyangiaceae bacterium]